MHRIYIKAINAYIDITDDGRFELPPMEYTLALINKITREIRKAMRDSKTNIDFD